MRLVYLILLGTLFSCTKQKDCIVTKIYSGNQEIKDISVVDGVTVTVIDKEYIIVLECY